MSKFIRFIQRVWVKIRRDGVYNALAQACLRFESAWFDKKYGVDTHRITQLSDLNISNGSVEHGRQYQPILVNHLRTILETLEPMPDDVLVDFGSGKGRVLLISSMYQFKKVVGVEFSDRLCAIADANVKKFKGRNNCLIKIHCADAGNYKIKREETVFYFFNPFDKVIMQKVIDNIKISLTEYPRRIRVVFHNVRPENRASSSDLFELVSDSTLHGIAFQIYETSNA
jgi:precorrin-6B methylase 2